MVVIKTIIEMTPVLKTLRQVLSLLDCDGLLYCMNRDFFRVSQGTK